MSTTSVRVAEIIATHHDHVWGRLPFLAPMAARVERERGAARGGQLRRLITELHALLFAHLDREDRVLLAIARREPAPGASRLHEEHAVVVDLLDRIRGEVGHAFRPAVDSGPTERLLCQELRELDGHLRAQIRLEEAVIAPLI